MWDYIVELRADLAFDSYQHLSMVVQALIIATVLALLVAILVTRVKVLEPIANAISAIGLTIPSFALLGLLIPIFGIGVGSAFPAVVFYALLPIMRNAVVGLQSVDKTLLESARGMGMNPVMTMVQVQLPLAWPVILTGIRVSAQMTMGVAAIAAYVLGPGLGKYIFTGLSQYGGANALYSALVGTIGVVLLAVILDLLLVLVGRLTTSKGIRV